MVAKFGKPMDVNRTVTAAGERKQMIYYDGMIVYTENGAVTAWQD